MEEAMVGIRTPLKTGLFALAGLLLMSSVALGQYRVLGYRGFYRPAYYGAYYRSFGYYGWPYGYRVIVSPGWGYAGYGPVYGGIGYGMAYGSYGYPALGVTPPYGSYGAMPPSYGNGSLVPDTN